MIEHHQYRNDAQHNGPCTWKYHLVPCGRPREDHREVDYTTKERDAVCPQRKAFILHVDLDSVPGTFHTPRSAYECIQAMLNDGVGAYAPIAIFGVAHPGEHAEDCDRKRVCFVIFVDLDPVPGLMHTQESAYRWLRLLFNNRIPHYHPIVSLAPAGIQPENIARGVRAHIVIVELAPDSFQPINTEGTQSA